MLNVKQVHKTLIVIVVLITLTGCGKTWKPRPIGFVNIPPSYPQALTVKNDSGEIIAILPASDSETRILVLDPGESVSVEFTVERIAELDESGSPKIETWTAEVDEPSLYVGMMDTDGVLKVETLSGEEWSYRIALGTCWFQNDPPIEEHELIIEDEEPVFGVPAVRLCE